MLLSFNFSLLGGEIVTERGPRQVYMVENMAKNNDDLIFSVSGNIAIKWHYNNSRYRIFLTGRYLNENNDNNDNKYGLVNDYSINVTAGKILDIGAEVEISNARNCSYQLSQDKSCERIA